jgi:single-stranded-DNA-specific exonuclease
MQYQWFYKHKGNDDKVETLAKSLNISNANASLLVQRGIETYEEAKNFFRPQLSQLHDPYLMKDMDLAIDRLTAAIRKNQRVLIYGDYDVDGTTSVALVYSFLKQFTQNIDYYVPDRYTEGYGVSIKGIDYAKETNCELIITLDCGIKANPKVEYAKTLGIDFIICDHHLPGKELPDAVAILDPKQIDCSYPDKDLSGCGVGFKLMQAFATKNSIEKEETFKLLDLVAVSIASDIVPIVGENRIMAYYGLKILNSNPRVGLQSLIQVSDLQEKNIEISDIVFKIGPRINAAGRLKSAKASVDLLLEQDYANAEKHALAINIINSERKDLDHDITEEALNMIKNSEVLSNRKSTVLFHPNWHKGVVGIVASRLIEHFYRPTIILSETDGILTGSARSVNGFNIYDAIEACSEFLDGYGGHMYAAGINLKKENFEAFSEKFEAVVNETITKDLLTPKIDVDLKINLEDIDQKFFNILSQMAPFGPGNLRPVLVSKNLVDSGYSKVVGKDASHLKLSVRHTQNTKTIDGIAFGKADFYPTISNESFALCYSLFENEFRGNKSIQMDVRDIQKC